MALTLRQRRNLQDLRQLGDVCDIQTQLIDADIVAPPHDLLPEWFAWTLLFAGSLIFAFCCLFQPEPFWWLY